MIVLKIGRKTEAHGSIQGSRCNLYRGDKSRAWLGPDDLNFLHAVT